MTKYLKSETGKEYRIPEVKLKMTMSCKTYELYPIKGSEDAAHVFRNILEEGELLLRENMIALHLNRANKILAYQLVSAGGMSGTMCDPKILFSYALKTGATSVIVSHNHPSGNLNPSAADTKLTQKIKEAGDYIDIAVLDHIIITDSGYYSYADETSLLGSSALSGSSNIADGTDFVTYKTKKNG